MAKQCIMCDEGAGSKEHVFPAALGGRRVDKGIYCNAHNNSLGVHVVALLEALEFFNAYLGVRSDHHDTPKPHLIEVHDGDRYQVLGDKVEIAAPPPLTKTPELVGKSSTLKFSSEAQRDKWMAEQRKLGFKFESTTSSKVETQYFTQPIRVRTVFGTKNFFRAVAYVGLTYLAHYFKDVARQDGLAAMKSYVLGGADGEDRVWWVDPQKISLTTDLEPGSVHTVAVSVSKESGKAMALVSFFGRISLAVELGQVIVGQTQCITTHIDPTAASARPGVDISVHRNLGSEIAAGTAAEGRDYHYAVVSGTRPNPIGDILKALQERHSDALVKQIWPILQNSILLPKSDQESVIRSIVDDQGQRVFNLLSYGVNELLEQMGSLPEAVKSGIASTVAADLAEPTGLSANSSWALAMAKAALTAEILRRLEANELTEDELKMLLAGGAGAALVTGAVLHELI